MKTPEEMAREYAITRELFDPHRITFDSRLWLEQGFLAGYKAAKDQLADTSKVMKFNKGNNAEKEKVNMKFAYDSFPVTNEQAQNVEQIRETFSSLTDLLSQLVPNGRYLSIVNTKLEEACMFAIKGITHQAGDYDKLQYKA